MPGTLLVKARKLFRKKKFPDLIKLLEPEVFQYRNSFSYYRLLGISCLRTGDLNGAQSYLDRARQLKLDDIDCRLALAAVHFRKEEYEDSLEIWLSILDQSPKNATARHGLGLLRDDAKLAKASSSQHAVKKIYPSMPVRLPWLSIVAGFLVLAALVVLIPLIVRKTPVRPELTSIQIPKRDEDLVDDRERHDLTLTAAQVRQIFEKARDLFNRYEDNLANIELNRLLGSNASEQIKDIARTLKDHLKRPDFSNFKGTLNLADVSANPALYQDCYVRWAGKLANLNVGPEQIRFDFLVGYHEEKELQGVVSVTLDFAANVKNGDNLDILAQVDYGAAGLSFKGVSIHKLR